MGYAVTAQTLRSENQRFTGTGGISRNNRSQAFQPGFYDAESGQLAISRFADGRPAPMHLLDGVPAEWVTARNAGGRVVSVKASVVAGFIRGGRFYTRAEAAAVTVPHRSAPRKKTKSI
jgi:hypothetical protein